MLIASLVSAGYRTCNDCYRADDDKVSQKCCNSVKGQYQSVGGANGPPGCYRAVPSQEAFAACCVQNKCEN